MISSTVWAEAATGRHANATRTGRSFFIGFGGPPRFLGLRANDGLRPMRYFTPLRRIWGGRASPGGSNGPDQRERGTIITQRLVACEGVNRIQDRRTKVVRRGDGGTLQKMLDPCQTEFVGRAVSLAFAGNDTARN